MVSDSKADFPLLIFHGTDDEIVPVSHGQKLNRLAKDANRNVTYFEFPTGHNNLPGPYASAYWELIEKFLRDNQILE